MALRDKYTQEYFDFVNEIIRDVAWENPKASHQEIIEKVIRILYSEAYSPIDIAETIAEVFHTNLAWVKEFMIEDMGMTMTN